MAMGGLWVFALVYFLAVATPGPGVAAVVARSLARGGRGALPFIGGFLVGDLIWFLLAAFGLAALAQVAYPLFVALKYAGAAYLVFLAWRLWRSKPAAEQGSAAEPIERPLSLFVGSLTLTLSNPKTMIFFLAVLPAAVPLENLHALGLLEIAAVMCFVLPLVLGLYVLLAAKARAVFQGSRAQRSLTRTTSVAMAGTALWVAVRE